jgi:nitroreductase
MRLHPVLATRFSPLRFAAAGPLADDQVELLLEAARWAPSAGNSQPWAFFTARPGDPDHARLVRHLAASAAAWAPEAGLLVVAMAHRYVEDTDWAYSEFADYDLGQAVAHLTIQAQAMSLACRQFRAFDLDALTADLAPAAGWQVVSMIAVGVPADSGAAQRDRRSTIDLRQAPWPCP